MEKNQNQYTTKQKMALAAKVMKRAVEISETTRHDVFCTYSPHVDWIEVHIHIGGWNPEKGYDDNVQIGFSGYHNTEAEIVEVMDKLDDLQQVDK